MMSRFRENSESSGMYVTIRMMCGLLLCVQVMFAGIQEAVAHGAVGVPIARQYQCRLERGYDYPADGSGIPHDDCRTAFQQGGNRVYPFQQWNEVAANPAGMGEKEEDVRRAVPDGLICAAGDPQKVGLDNAPATVWRKTRVVPKDGKIELRWDNTQAHVPAVMREYLSKPSYDPSRPLRWSDLDKLDEISAPYPEPANGGGRLPDVTTFTRYNVPIPAGRTGDAVLVSYWQRRDAGNEGFFNCSDITIVGDTVEPGFPWIDSNPYLESGFAPNVGDAVRFRVMGGNARGTEVVDVRHPITDANVQPQIWARELADTLNRSHGNYVRIGVRAGNDIHYNATDLVANRIWLKQGYSSAMGIVAPEPPPQPITATLTVPGQVRSGEPVPVHVDAKSETGRPLSYVWSRTSALFDGSIGNQPSGNYTAAAVTQPTNGVIGVTVSDDHGNSLPVPNRTVTVSPAEGGTPVPLPSISLNPPHVSGSAPATVRLTSSASVTGATISKVEYFNGGIRLGEASATPYRYDWQNVAAGSYNVTGKATTSQGASTTSAPVPVTVTPSDGGGTCDYRDPAATGVPAWQGRSYNGGERVSYQNVIWQAGYSTGTAAPDRNDAWTLVSNVPVPYSAARAFEGGKEVTYQGSVYRAGWWTKGTAPPASPWTRVGPCQ
ncbi:lytic polysaccharide monooxygenase [Burkholderia sp. AW49-1]